MFAITADNESSHRTESGGISTTSYQVVGLRAIPSGTIILQEPPINCVQISGGNMMWELTKQLIIHDQFKHIKTLCSHAVSHAPIPSDYQRFAKINRMASQDVLKCYNIVNRNAYVITDFFTFHQHGLGLYPLISRINHSCNANCVLVYDGNTACIISRRDLVKDEEITLNYYLLATSWVPRSLRKELISNHYDFACKCTMCQFTISLEWDIEASNLFRVIEKSGMGQAFLTLGNVLIKAKRKALEGNSSLFVIFSILYIRSFLHDGVSEDDAALAAHLAAESMERLGNLEGNYFHWYAEILCRKVLELPEIYKTDQLLINDQKNCSVL